MKTFPIRIAAALLALAVVALPAAASAREYSDPEQLQTDAYVALAQADTALDESRYADALALYEDALQLYNGLAEQFPSFKPSIVRYRTSYCKNQIADVQAKASGASAEPADTAEPADGKPAAKRGGKGKGKTAEPPAKPANDSAFAELDGLRDRITSFEARLAESAATIDKLTAENQALTTTNGELVNQLSKAQTQITALKAELKAAETDLDDSRELHLALNDAEAQTAELHAQVADLEEENDRLLAEAEDLEKAAIDAQSAAGMAKARIAFLEAELDALRNGQPAPAPAADAPAAPVEVAAAEPPAAEPPSVEIPSTLVAEPFDVAEDEPVAEPADEPAPYRANAAPAPIPANQTPETFIRQLAEENLPVALATVQAVRADNPEKETLANLEATLLIRLEAYNDASALLIPFVQKHPKNADLQATLGAAMLGAGDYDEARETLETAVKLNSKIAEAHYNLALLYAFADPIDLKAARKHYEAARKNGIPADPSIEQAIQ